MIKRSKENIQVQVGAFLAIGILLFLTAILMLGSQKSFFQNYYTLVCYFDDISGLRVGAPVQLVGFNVGFIDRIEFEERRIKGEQSQEAINGENESQESKDRTIVKVKVVMRIDTAFKNRIRSDTVASVKTQGLLGDRMIYLTIGSNDMKVLNDGDEVREIKQPTGFTELVQKGDDLMVQAQTFIENTDRLVNNVNKIIVEVIEGQGLVHEVIYNKDSGESIKRVDQILQNFERASQNLASITGKIDNGQGTLGALVNDDSLYLDIKTLMGKANRNRLIKSVIRYTIKTKENQQLK